MPTKQSKRKSKEQAGKPYATEKSTGNSTGADDMDSTAGDVNLNDEIQDSTDEVKLEFPYAELVRAYAPKAMDVAEKVATDWKKDGSFMNLGIENAYANMAVSLGLQKAKELEKKLDEKGVLSAVRMGVEVLKEQVKQQVNKKK